MSDRAVIGDRSSHHAIGATASYEQSYAVEGNPTGDMGCICPEQATDAQA